MEKLLREIKNELKENNQKNEKYHKELINYLAFQSQVIKMLANDLKKIKEEICQQSKMLANDLKKIKEEICQQSTEKVLE